MNAAVTESVAPAAVPSVGAAVDRACASIAPTWPLDSLIAVNPWWELRSEPFPEVSARLAALAGVRCLMPRADYAGRWGQEIHDRHLQRAAEELNLPNGFEQIREQALQAPPLPHWHNVSEIIDGVAHRHGNQMPWGEEIIHQISQYCAASFQPGGPLTLGELQPGSLYEGWLAMTREDRGIAVLMGEPALPKQFAALPGQHRPLLTTALDELGVRGDVVTAYAQALLLDVNGWASWIANLRWQAALDGQNTDIMDELLAIRLAWELVLWRHQQATDASAHDYVRRLWQRQLIRLDATLEVHRAEQRPLWVWQRAAELAYQESVQELLRRPSPATAAGPPRLQAAFCIDVRSEIMRRALEAQDPGIRTLGFAGFFGLPIDYQPAGMALVRPQLPGLLSPSILVTEAAPGPGRAASLTARARRLGNFDAPPATFSLVEATGLGYALQMLKSLLWPDATTSHPVNALPRSGAFEIRRDGADLDVGERAELAAGVLQAMGLTAGFAPLVLLVGHGSSNRNNPHAAGLDCGACGGQTGEINARVLAALLNDAAVRRALAERGIEIPAQTRFVAALHDTTTDGIDCFDDPDIPAEVRGWLEEAGRTARRERAAKLGLDDFDDARLLSACRRRGRDFSEVRPEWGLAGNAAFIVAPRQRTRHLDLGGRAFLHDYDWRRDDGFGVLELIMTAPMLVTHWINMQYNASVTDHARYGSGNKVLHNVVGGHLGVFEGNGGDLRIGLPLQSIHDGERWMHEPLRLAVYIAAPRHAMADIAARHAAVRELVDNDWLYLFRLDDDGRGIERYHRGTWLEVPEQLA